MELEQPSIPLTVRLVPYKNYFYIAAACLVLLSFFLVKLGGRKHRAEADFVAATNAFDKWDSILDRESDELKSLTRHMEKHPELKAQYEASLAQNFIAIQAKKEASTYGQRAIDRTNQPYYGRYAKGSLLLSEGKYDEALTEALSLKETMLEDESFWEKGSQLKGFGSGLFAFNLMRIATIYQELSDKANELEAWNELKAYAGWNGLERKDVRIGQEGFQSLLSHFTVQDITLLDYISMREKEVQ